MSKRAILLITPALKDDGSPYDLKLSMDDDTSAEGVIGTWHLPQNFGWGTNDAGTYWRGDDATQIILADGNGVQTAVIVGVNALGASDFPFVSADQSNKSTGPLRVQADNSYLKAGTYTWTIDSVV